MKLRVYLWEKKSLIAMLVFCFIFTGVMIWLTETGSIFQSNGFYATLVSLILLVVYFMIDYLRLNAHCRKLNILLQQEGTDLIVAIPPPYTAEQKLYTAVLGKLKQDSDASLALYSQKSAEDIDFMEAWVHEIKTPIAAAKLIIENNLDAPTEKTLYALSDEIEKVEDMIQTTLCYSHLSDFSRDCQISQIEIMPILNLCIQREYSNIVNKGIQLDLKNVSFEVNSDTKWLQFILKQLIDNAVKYSRPKGRIEFSATTDPSGHTLVIRDFGVGMKEEDLRRVFEKGFTGLNGRNNYTSTGVGLYLSQKLAAKLGHTIGISSTLGEGTEISIRFLKYQDLYRLE